MHEPGALFAAIDSRDSPHSHDYPGNVRPGPRLAGSLDHFFAVSRRVHDDLVQRYGIRPDAVSVIYNGVTVPPPGDLRSHGKNGEPFHLLYAGRLSDLDKGVLLIPDILERVAARRSGILWTIVGAGPDGSKLESELSRRGLMNVARMTGNVSLEEMDALLAKADCFVLPSRFEGCPNALLEAMAAGCACVAARIRGSVDQIIDHGKNGLMADAGSAPSFAEAILRVAEAPELCRNMGEAARRTIADRFTMEHMADHYAATIQAIMTSPDRREPARALDRYDVPAAMRPTWRTRVPAPLKNFARKWLERAGVSC